MPRPTLTLKAKNTRDSAIKLGATPCPECDAGWLVYRIQTDETHCSRCEYREVITPPTDPFAYPACWLKGQLLNVRNNGSRYVLTLLEEEYNPEHPERALSFADAFECNNFLGWWYARLATDGRAG